jgi:hypothetical protein
VLAIPWQKTSALERSRDRKAAPSSNPKQNKTKKQSSNPVLGKTIPARTRKTGTVRPANPLCDHVNEAVLKMLLFANFDGPY